MVTRGDRRWEWGSQGGTQAESWAQNRKYEATLTYSQEMCIMLFLNEKVGGVMERVHFTMERRTQRSNKEQIEGVYLLSKSAYYSWVERIVY